MDVLFSAADLVRALGDVDRATTYTIEVLDLARGLDDAPRIARALHGLLGESAMTAEEPERPNSTRRRSQLVVRRGRTERAPSQISDSPHCSKARMDAPRRCPRKRSHSSVNVDIRAVCASL